MRLSLDRFMVHEVEESRADWFDEAKIGDQFNTKHNYELYAVVSHSGSMRGGHYVSYVSRVGEDGEKKWFYISDDSVSETSESRVLDAEAYLLFYHRI